MKRNDANPTIAFDTWVLSEHIRHHGVHVYGRELLKYFRELSERHSVDVEPFVSRGNGNGANAFAAAPGFQPCETGLLRRSRLWRFGGAWALASWRNPDVVFSPQCTTLYMKQPVPVVTTIHDAIPLVMPWKSHKLRTVQFLLRSAAKASRAVITVSERSKADLVDACGVQESRISVVYNGYDHEVFNEASPDPSLLGDVRARHGIVRDYVFHHGVIKPSKNLKRLIDSYRLALNRNPNLDLDLVLAGPLGWEYEDVVTAAHEEKPRGRVILTGALSQPDLALLLKGARLVVIPSLYEGFCIPMIEAMACGVPTIAANSSCLPEISGGVLRYFDPGSEDEMATCMDAVLENDSLQRELSGKGQARAQEFSWRRCADQTLSVLAGVAREARS